MLSLNNVNNDTCENVIFEHFKRNNFYKITTLDTYVNAIFDLILLMTLLKMSSLFHVNNDAYKSIIFEQFLLKNNILIPLLK